LIFRTLESQDFPLVTDELIVGIYLSIHCTKSERAA